MTRRPAGVPDEVRIRGEHGIDLEPADVERHGYVGYRGRLDGLLEVTCYCGRTSALLTPALVRRGATVPSCGRDGCH